MAIVNWVESAGIKDCSHKYVGNSKSRNNEHISRKNLAADIQGRKEIVIDFSRPATPEFRKAIEI